MPSLLSFQLFALSILPFVLSVSQNQCILIPLPSSERCFPSSENRSETFTMNDSVTMVTFNSRFQYSTLLRYISVTVSSSQNQVYTTKAVNCSEVIGVVGDVDVKTAEIVSSLAERLGSNVTLVSAVTPTTFQPLVDIGLPNVVDMNPLIHYIRTLISLTDELSWTRVGLITDGTIYYQFAAELLQEFGRSLTPLIVLNKNPNLHYALQVVQEYNTQIIIVFVNKPTAYSLLEEARKMGLTWPSYGWIVLDAESGASLQSFSDLERVIIVKDFAIKSAARNHSVINTCSGNSFETIPSSILMDSIFAVTLASEGTQIYNASFRGSAGPLQFRNGKRLNNISVIQVMGGSEVEIARYDSATQQLTITVDILESDSPRGGILTVYQQNITGHNVLFVLLTIFCTVYVTVILILYILFHKEPEIKSTSVAISLSMFVACYLMISLVPVLLVKAYPDASVAVPHRATCHFIAWLGGTGVPFPMILATILVKMLRIYAIVQNPLSYKKRFFADYLLLVYILLLLTPTVLILSMWSSIDPLIILDGAIPMQHSKFIIEICLSTHTTVWLTVPYAYLLLLIIAVVVVGFKTSSVRYKYLQDANATNVFIFVAIATAFMGNMFGYIFVIIRPSSTNYISAEISVSICNLAIVVTCQTLLFLPKVYFPTKRWLFRNEVRKK